MYENQPNNYIIMIHAFISLFFFFFGLGINKFMGKKWILSIYPNLFYLDIVDSYYFWNKVLFLSLSFPKMWKTLNCIETTTMGLFLPINGWLDFPEGRWWMQGGSEARLYGNYLSLKEI